MASWAPALMCHTQALTLTSDKYGFEAMGPFSLLFLYTQDKGQKIWTKVQLYRSHSWNSPYIERTTGTYYKVHFNHKIQCKPTDWPDLSILNPKGQHNNNKIGLHSVIIKCQPFCGYFANLKSSQDYILQVNSNSHFFLLFLLTPLLLHSLDVFLQLLPPGISPCRLTNSLSIWYSKENNKITIYFPTNSVDSMRLALA